MDYQELNVVPPYERFNPDQEPAPGHALWSNEAPPPPIGAPIVARINNCGPAIVTGYFLQGGFLGVLCRLIDPPEWHSRQNNGNPTGHLFGVELRLPKDEREALEIRRKALLAERLQTADHFGARARIQAKIDAIESQLAELA